LCLDTYIEVYTFEYVNSIVEILLDALLMAIALKLQLGRTAKKNISVCENASLVLLGLNTVMSYFS
jgi:hypothetical protein